MPTLDWLNRASAFTTAACVPYRLLELHVTTPEPAVPLLVCCKARRLGKERLRQANVTRKHTPYDVRAR